MVKCIKCANNAYYNIETEKAKYCKTHSTKDMVNVVDKRKCKQLGCPIRKPTFNYIDKKNGEYCGTHKKDDMVNVIEKRKCKECGKQPTFNYNGESKGIYCTDHKKKGMIDVKNTKCKDCNKVPIYNFKDENKGVYCVEHKKDNMIDVVNLTCLDCHRQPSYNFKDKNIRLYCEEHKKNGMINIKSIRCQDCDKIPNFNFKGKTKGIYCDEHKKNNMMNVVSSKCVSCNLYIVNNKGDLCAYCNPESTKRQKTKEMEIKNLLEKHNILFIHDKGVSNICCLKYRPDFVIQCTTNDNIYYIVLEVDEFAHKRGNYTPECEESRMNNISLSLGLPTKFIRCNPDLKGITKKIKEEILIKRLDILMNHFDNDITEEYLFYP